MSEPTRHCGLFSIWRRLGSEITNGITVWNKIIPLSLFALLPVCLAGHG